MKCFELFKNTVTESRILVCLHFISVYLIENLEKSEEIKRKTLAYFKENVLPNVNDDDLGVIMNLWK